MRTIRKRHRLHVIRLAFALFLLSTTPVSFCVGADQRTSEADFFVGHPAPDFHLKDLDGREVQLSSLRGNIVLLDFWASWCGPCRAELPAIEDISKHFAKKDVIVIGVDSGEPEDTVRRFVQKSKLTYRIALTTETADVIRAYGAVALPTVVLIDKNGIIAAYRVGERPDSEKTLQGDIHNVLSSKYVAPKPKAVQMAQMPGATPAAPVNSAPGGPDPNWKPETADEFLGRGFIRLNMHQNGPAEADAEEALKLSPDSCVARFLHGRAAYEQKDYSTAIEDFNKVVQGRPNWPQGYHYRGLSYSYQGQHERALPDYAKMLQLNAYIASAYNDMGWAYRELKQFDKAKANLDKAIELEPDYVRARENRAILFANQNDWADELSELAILLHLAPNDQWAKQAKEAAQQGNALLPVAENSVRPETMRPDVQPRVISKIEPEYTEEARRAGVNAVVLCSTVINPVGVPQDIKVVRGAGFGLDENAIRALATWKFEPAKRQGVPVADTAQVEINFRILHSKHENQRVSLEFTLPPGGSRPQLIHGSVPENPADSADGDLQIAFTVDTHGNLQEISVLKTTSNDWAQTAMAEIKDWRFRPAAIDGRAIETKGIFEIVTKSPGSAWPSNGQEPDPTWQPKTAEEFLARGYARLRIHKYPQAEADADDALKLCPDSVMALFLRGRAAYDDKEYATALEAFEKVTAQRPDWAEAYRYRGLSYSRSGQHQRAIPDYQKAIELEPEYANAYNDLGWAYTELGQLELARSNLDKAVELEPNMLAARVNRAKLFSKQGDFSAEQKDLAIILGLYPKNQWAKDTLEAVRQKLQ